MANFVVEGPYKVDFETTVTGAKLLDERCISELSEKVGLQSPGCYVFAVRAAKGTLPIYVGMTQKQSIFKEAFNSNNRISVTDYVNRRKKGSLLLYAIHRGVNRRGRPSIRYIPDIELFLIEKCRKRNSALINIQNNRPQDWSIRGVVNSGQGKPSATAASFRALIGI